MSAENPYEPPKAGLNVPTGLREKRPASTKVLITILTVFVLIWCKMYRDAVHMFGLGAVIEEQTFADPVLFGVITWLFLLISNPRRLVYIFGSLWIGYMAATPVWMLFNSDPQLELLFPDQGQSLPVAVFVILQAFLFYRFTFGLPSRTYYGIGSAKNETER
ncbi:MAG: hypothetical protein V4662_00010 [Verrucomicrobiota bacterium]